MKKKPCVLIFAALCAFAGFGDGKEIVLVSPREGEVVSLVSDELRSYFAKPRAERERLFTNATYRTEMARWARVDKPVKLRWLWCGHYNPMLTVEVFAPDGKRVFSGRTAAPEIDVPNLEIGRAYRWRVSGHPALRAEPIEGTFVTADDAPRALRFPHIYNLRDIGGRIGLGGRRIRQGLVYRSGGINDNAITFDRPKEEWQPGEVRMTADECAAFLAFTGLKTDLDLRNEWECFGMDGSPLGPSVNWIECSSWAYGELGEKKGKDAFAKVFKVFLDGANYPIDFHCITGADRTGTVAFILNALLGVGLEDLYRDWEATALYSTRMDFYHARCLDRLVAVVASYPGETLADKTAAFVKDCGFADADIAFFRAQMLEASPFNMKVRGTVVGDVAVSCAEPGAWKVEAAQETSDGVSVVTVRLAAPAVAKPPKFTVSFDAPGVGADHVWTPYDDRYWLRPLEWGATPYESQLAFRAPLAAAYRVNGENMLALACSEAFDSLKYGITVGASDCRLHGELAFFTEYAAPRAEYEARIRIDTRRVRWSEGVSDAAAWVSKAAGLEPCPVPDAARDPMYSTWYAFWQDVKADVLEREAPLAAELGMKAMILDDGWQKEKSRTYYSATGDWMPVRGRFPDMKAHVEKIHAAGLKYILWLSVPFVGDESAAYGRFRGKFLCEADPGSGTYVLDVRFPDVREYLIATYERAVREWGFDGLKLDFIDLFKVPASGDPAEKEGWKGRDIRSLPVAVDTLMKDVRRRLSAINPDVLIEFRQQYMGPAIRQYGNMIRATDCPADSDKIRKLVCDLRLTSGTTAVHSDMLVWHPDETPERAARPILNSLFSTIQYSMVLARLPEAHRAVIRHWLAFTQAHRHTLLDGAFRPEHPEALYPLVMAESATECIAVAYTAGTIVPASAGKPVWAVNATDAEGLVVDASEAGTAEMFDTFGVSRGKVPFAAGLIRLAVPPSGYAVLRN